MQHGHEDGPLHIEAELASFEETLKNCIDMELFPQAFEYQAGPMLTASASTSLLPVSTMRVCSEKRARERASA